MNEKRTFLIIALTAVAFGGYLAVANINTAVENTFENNATFGLVSVESPNDMSKYVKNEGPAPPSLNRPEQWRGFVIGALRDMLPAQRRDHPMRLRSTDSGRIEQSMTDSFSSQTTRSEGAEVSDRPATTMPPPDQPEVQRYSSTNVQEQGIDEPDIVKTDGDNIYFSTEEQERTRTIRALPVEAMRVRQRLKQSGDLLFRNGRMVQLSSDIHGFTTTADGLDRDWTVSLDGSLGRDDIETARLIDEKLFVVFHDTNRDLREGCPFEYFGRTIPCEDVLRPDQPLTNPDSLFVVATINTDDGTVESVNSVVGQSRGSAVYASPSSLYIAYTMVKKPNRIMIDYALGPGADQLPGDLLARIQATVREDGRQAAADQHARTVVKTLDEQRTGREDLRAYLRKRSTDIVRTGIAEFGIDDLQYRQGRSLPGHLLNQFSLDESDGKLRVATTVERIGGSSSSRVTILNDDFEVAGRVTGLGQDQRIYAVRFMEDRAYVVTFRRRDPFYIIDLSDPADPAKTGKLKMPGYSSYLHPIDENRVVGIGKKTDGPERTKVVLFDVRDNTDPRILSRHVLNERKSAVDETHHAFLHDPRHSVFFLPAGQTGYVFGYDDDTLRIKARSNTGRVKRALFINDYLYMLSPGGVTVLNERDWQGRHRFDFPWPDKRDNEPGRVHPGRPEPNNGASDLYEKLQQLRKESGD